MCLLTHLTKVVTLHVHGSSRLVQAFLILSILPQASSPLSFFSDISTLSVSVIIATVSIYLLPTLAAKHHDLLVTSGSVTNARTNILLMLQVSSFFLFLIFSFTVLTNRLRGCACSWLILTCTDPDQKRQCVISRIHSTRRKKLDRREPQTEPKTGLRTSDVKPRRRTPGYPRPSPSLRNEASSSSKVVTWWFLKCFCT